MGHNYIVYANGKVCLELLAHVCHVFPEQKAAGNTALVYRKNVKDRRTHFSSTFYSKVRFLV